MVVDSSAAVAILNGEPEAESFARALEEASDSMMSAASYLETGIVMDRDADPVVRGRLDELLIEANVRIEPVTELQARIAREAYRDFGRGSGHPARLNFGDCLSYALAKATDKPLLFKGDDFSQTDVRAAVP